MSAIYIMNEKNVMCVLAPRVYVFFCVPIAKVALHLFQWPNSGGEKKRINAQLAFSRCMRAVWQHGNTIVVFAICCIISYCLGGAAALATSMDTAD